MADTAHRLTDEKLEEMEKRLSAIYSRAEKEIGERWKEYLAESQAEIDELQKAYDLAKEGGDPKEIRKAGRKLSKAKRDRTLMNNRFKDLTERTAAELANVNKTALAYINGQLPEVYSINYNVLAPTVDGVGGYSFALVDADTVKNLATTDKSLLPYKELDEKKDIRWNVKKMNAEVLQGIVQGEPMDRIASRLSKVIGMDETAAIRNARTMVTGAENKGRQDSYARAEADGIILQKEWLATNDGRTRHSHAALDGSIVDQDKKFDNGLMYPGDPSGRPEEVYNCRCTLVAKVNGFKKVQVQKKYEDVHDLPQKPTRPKKLDYANEEEYMQARNRYKKEKDLYNQAVEDTIKKTFDRKAIFDTKDEARKWLKSNGIRFSDDFIDTVDIRAFDDIVPVTEKMFEKYPFTRRFTGFDFDGNEVDSVFGFWITTDADTLMESQSGIGFAKSYFSDYKEAIKANIDLMSSGWTVSGDGTIRTPITHEFGHRVESYLSQLSVSKYGSTKQLSKEIEEIAQAAPTGSSKYSKTTYQEFFAEGFAAYESGEGTEFARAFGNLLKRWLG